MPQRLLIALMVIGFTVPALLGLSLFLRSATPRAAAESAMQEVVDASGEGGTSESTGAAEAPEASAASSLEEAEIGGAEVDLDSVQSISYAIGYDIGRSFRRRQLDLDSQELWHGLRAGLGEGDPRMSEHQVSEILSAFQVRMQRQAMEQRQAEAATNLEQGQSFLEENRAAEGVMQTDSGLQFKIIEPGQGASPEPGDVVVVHYTGQFINGDVFDSSRERGQPARFPIEQVIPGWTEGLQLMKEGGRYKLFVPPELAYGEQGHGEMMPPNATLIFDIELLEVRPEGR